MINSGKYLNYIIEKITLIRYEFMSKSKLNLLDDNVIIENFIAQLMNYIYGYNLSNLNQEKSNFSGLDLGDKQKKIGVQVTSTSKSIKINDTLEKINRNESCKVFDIIKIFILSEKQSKYSINNNYSRIKFDFKTDILDFDDLFKAILYVPVDIRFKICEFIRSEITEVLSSLEADYYNLYDFKRCVKGVSIEDWKKMENMSIN